MNGPYADDLPGYRAALRTWLASPAVDPWRSPGYQPDVAVEMAESAGLMRLLYDAQFGRYGFTVESGGLGGDLRHWAVLWDEMGRADVQIPGQHALLVTLAPAVMHFAPELAARFLPAFMRGESWWAQGFSEPEAGSDLAALRCRARRTADGYVVSGQKLWTSHAPTASHLVCLLRTGTAESRHRGLSMMLVDTYSPGLTIRPITLAGGRAELAECFFDDVPVPADRLIGEHDGGWAVAMYLLQFERAGYAWLRHELLLGRLRALGRRVAPGETSAQVIGSAYLDLAIVRAQSVETVRRLGRGESVGPEASVDKILLGTAEHAVIDASRRLLGSAFTLGSDTDVQHWRDEWWYGRAATIYGGSAEVQRGIVADRVLGLPKA